MTLHAGTGPGLSPRPLGQKGGVEDVTINTNQLPSHDHEPLKATSDGSSQLSASGNLLALAGFDVYRLAAPASPMASTATTQIGGNAQHTNLQPFLCINCIVALFGDFPSRR